MVLQEALGLTLKIDSGLDTKPRHLSCRRRPDAVKLSHGQRLDEGRPIFGVITKSPSGLR